MVAASGIPAGGIAGAWCIVIICSRFSEEFLPQIIPFYAATQIFNRLRKDYPDYTYKEATLNPSNPRDRAVEWEADLINYFRNNPGEKELQGERDTPTGRTLYLAHAIKANESDAHHGQDLRQRKRVRMETGRSHRRPDRFRTHDRAA
jgi:hypothetical protein